MKTSISFVYFDLGDVVVGSSDAHKQMAAQSTASLTEVIAFLGSTEQERGRGHIGTDVYMRTLKKHLGLTHTAEDFIDMWSDLVTPIHETHALIRELVPQYRLGILSNAERGVIAKELEKGKIPNIAWEVIIESGAVGYMKPDKEIFALAQSKTGVAPHEILFIDDRAGNIAAAQQLGWQTFLFDIHSLDASLAALRKILLP